MTTVWESPPKPFTLDDGSVHVWRVALDDPAWNAAPHAHLLNAEERARADRFRLAPDKERFIAGRGVLRTLIALYGDCDPKTVRFAFSEHGKPSLFESAGSAQIEFNVSHSGNIVLVALTRAAAVGVDVESLARRAEEEKLAERFFSRDEVERLNAIPESERRMAFYECWSRKEAFIKAHGHGLTLALDSFSVAFGMGAPARLIRFDGDPAAANWSMDAPAVAEGYAGAVCLAAPGGTFHYFDATRLASRH